MSEPHTLIMADALFRDAFGGACGRDELECTFVVRLVHDEYCFLHVRHPVYQAMNMAMWASRDPTTIQDPWLTLFHVDRFIERSWLCVERPAFLRLVAGLCRYWIAVRMLQRRARRWLDRRRRCALAMSQHPRLGADSPAHVLPEHLMCMIADMATASAQ